MSTANNIAQWSTTAASNATADTGLPSMSDTMDPIGLDNVPRGMMAALAKWRLDIGGALSAGGSANVLTVTTNGLLEAAHMAAGLTLVVKATADNTSTTVTFNPDSRGALNVKRSDGSALAVGSIKSGAYLILVYEASTPEWRVANIPPGMVTNDVANTFSAAGAQTIKNTSDSSAVQVASFEGDRATMADNDTAYLSLKLSDDGGTQTEFGRLSWLATDVSDTTEDGALLFGVMTAGTLANKLVLTGASLYPLTDNGLNLGAASLGFNVGYLETIELGHDTDTTLARSAAGVLSVEGGSGSLYVSTIELGASSDTTLSRGAAGRLQVEGTYLARLNSTDADSLLDTLGSTKGNIIYHNGTSWVVLAPP